MNEEKENWENFKKTGKIEDYLKYKQTVKENKTNNSLWKDVKNENNKNKRNSNTEKIA